VVLWCIILKKGENSLVLLCFSSSYKNEKKINLKIHRNWLFWTMPIYNLKTESQKALIFSSPRMNMCNLFKKTPTSIPCQLSYFGQKHQNRQNTLNKSILQGYLWNFSIIMSLENAIFLYLVVCWSCHLNLFLSLHLLLFIKAFNLGKTHLYLIVK